MKKHVTSMTKKNVELTLRREITIGLSKAKFIVQDGCRKFGELQVSQGSVVWFSRYGKLGYKLSWERFDRIMRGVENSKCRKR
jgi:hypothetical protein